MRTRLSKREGRRKRGEGISRGRKGRGAGRGPAIVPNRKLRLPMIVEEPEVLVFTRLINSVRIRNIPMVNFSIIGLLGFFLIKLTTKYTGLYMKNSLITIIVTNLVLFGISETLAQSLLCYNPHTPLLSVAMHRSPAILSFNDSLEPFTDNDDNLVQEFLDYVQREDEPIPLLSDHLADLGPPLTYFQFNRLAGFMVWGFTMAFAQCWWYKFLQIYAEDSKFIQVLRKVLTDQLCYSPISLFSFFCYGTMVLESGTWEDTKQKLERIYLKTLLINYSVWFPVQFVNFLLVPRNFQVPFSSSVSVLWNCFLSIRNSSSS